MRPCEVLGQFAGVLAHDVRNHLAAVTWSAELMAAELAPDSPHREDVEIIRTATRGAISMTKSVLEYARPSGDVKGSTEVAAHLDGTGLGLSSVFLIVSRTGGAIRVDSTPGEGTMFTVDLPIAGGRSA